MIETVLVTLHFFRCVSPFQCNVVVIIKTILFKKNAISVFFFSRFDGPRTKNYSRQILQRWALKSCYNRKTRTVYAVDARSVNDKSTFHRLNKWLIRVFRVSPVIMSFTGYQRNSDPARRCIFGFMETLIYLTAVRGVLSALSNPSNVTNHISLVNSVSPKCELCGDERNAAFRIELIWIFIFIFIFNSLTRLWKKRYFWEFLRKIRFLTLCIYI